MLSRQEAGGRRQEATTKQQTNDSCADQEDIFAVATLYFETNGLALRPPTTSLDREDKYVLVIALSCFCIRVVCSSMRVTAPNT